VYELVLAFAELEKKRPGLHLHIGGSSNKFSDYNDALHSLVRKLNLQDQVTFYGDVSEPWTWYPKIDVFVSNSYSEGLQVAPMEAMASARYCLSHHWDGAEELLPVDHLFLTDAELQERILAYCDLPEDEKRREQAEMRAIASEKFDLELIKGQIRDVIESAAEVERVRA
jgi:glycosyltransferase involved in cell wall biosynthesis